MKKAEAVNFLEWCVSQGKVKVNFRDEDLDKLYDKYENESGIKIVIEQDIRRSGNAEGNNFLNTQKEYNGTNE